MFSFYTNGPNRFNILLEIQEDGKRFNDMQRSKKCHEIYNKK